MLTRELFEIAHGPVSDTAYALIVEMHTTIETLREQVADLKTLVKELKDRLDKDSHNSSKPPSSDGLQKKPVTLRRKIGRKPGGQQGHPGRTLTFAETPEHTIVHLPHACRGCGAELDQTPSVLNEKRQVFDIAPIQLECTEHQAYTKCCPECGERTTALFPTGVQSSVQYGPRFGAAMLYCTQYQMLPTDRTREMAADLFGASVSEGTLYNIIKRASAALSPVETDIKDALAKQKVTHHDETGARVSGSLHWFHVACTAMLTVYFPHKNRGKAAMDAMGVLANSTGRAVHDGWKPYFHYSCRHGLCNVHHLRELLAVFEQEGQQWAQEMSGVLLDMKKEVARASEEGRSNVPVLTQCKLEGRYKAALAAGYRANPPPERSGKRGRTRRTVGGNLVRRLDTYQAETLAFFYDFAVPFDNNLAERDIRMIKVRLNVSGCFRSEEGADQFARIRGYISTMRKQGHNVLDTLLSVCRGNPTLPALGATQP